MDASASRELWRHARSNIVIINPDAPVAPGALDGAGERGAVAAAAHPARGTT
jgi:hypothetical protein